MIRVLVAGLGNMGRSHALAYHDDPAFQVVGLVNRSAVDIPEALRGYAVTPDFHEALARLRPDKTLAQLKRPGMERKLIARAMRASDPPAAWIVRALAGGCTR